MDYHWRCADTQGRDVAVADVAGVEERFGAQVEAEEWLTDNWEDLRAAGVDAVTLLQNGAEVYGPMSLHPAAG